MTDEQQALPAPTTLIASSNPSGQAQQIVQPMIKHVLLPDLHVGDLIFGRIFRKILCLIDCKIFKIFLRLIVC